MKPLDFMPNVHWIVAWAVFWKRRQPISANIRHDSSPMMDDEAYHMTEKFIKEFRDNVHEMSDYRRRRGQEITSKR
jgi:hypothetical protein